MTIQLSRPALRLAPEPALSAAGPARATALIDPSAIGANVRTLQAHTRAALMAVVKADGFGHGAATVARAALAAGADSLGVTGLDEGLAMRNAAPQSRVLTWLHPVETDWRTAAAADLEIAVPSLDHLAAIVRSGAALRIHLQVDTGMARDGAPPEAWWALCRAARLAEAHGRVTVVGVMGHLACSDQPGHPANRVGRRRFAVAFHLAEASGLRPRWRHLAATAATLTDPASHHDLVRVGAGLVGIDPSGTTALRWAMTLTAPVVEVRRVAAGTPVGYGHTWVADRRTTLALLPLGYADGLPRLTSGRAEVLVRGRRRPLVGRISMDQVVVDVGDDDVRPGEEAVVFGPGDRGEPTPADWATWASTLPHEILTGIGARVERQVRR